jgi:rod shape-determining protein MreC
LSLRDGPFGDIRVPLTWSAAAALVIAVIIAAALLLGDRRETMKVEAYDTARHAVDAVASPVGGTLSTPVRWAHSGLETVRGYFFAVSENRKLKAELAADRVWRDRLEAMQVENDRYRAMLGVRTDPPLPHVFAHTVLDARGAFANTRLADAGSDRGVVEGNPVLSERGVVGRIVGVSTNVSRIMLLTDVESRTPILIVRTNGRAILSGDGGGSPKLDYIRGAPLKEGDRVLTSGDGGVFPRGLPVGTVVKGVNGAWRVSLDADASPVDDVQILLFKDFAQLVDEQALAPRELPTAMTEEPSQAIVGAQPKPGASAPAAVGAAAHLANGQAAKPASAARVAGQPAKPGDAAHAAAKPAKPSASALPAAKPAKPGATAHVAARPAKPSATAKPADSAPTAGKRAKPSATAHVAARPAKPGDATLAASRPAKPAAGAHAAKPVKANGAASAAAKPATASHAPRPATHQAKPPAAVDEPPAP